MTEFEEQLLNVLKEIRNELSAITINLDVLGDDSEDNSDESGFSRFERLIEAVKETRE